ncbi:hypothetical protein EZJ43_06220 [Pedobacter changchengzhani]|uniref:DUF4890 domain-containing protein n=1 Tax=Pedobacter changchengzhani TaxID=2529274 RepID=A0A4V3A0A3_9SPHI|nr:hypothetical protein [Pedobacter changchengzhani]TDG36873.1 hypothetical protein EZJ43_06220 [Pedobacter changchengzhani]
MKKLMMICALVFSVMTYANAQQKNWGTPEERAQKMTDRLVEKLKLNDDQKEKVSTIYMDQAKAMTKIREEAGDDKVAMREKVMKLRRDDNDKIDALLTNDQKATYKVMQDEQKERMKKGGDRQKTTSDVKPAENM